MHRNADDSKAQPELSPRRSRMLPVSDRASWKSLAIGLKYG
jgi:hypothetical protein